MALESNRLIMKVLEEQIKVVEQSVLEQVKLDSRYRCLLSIDGIGKILALTIMLETGSLKGLQK